MIHIFVLILQPDKEAIPCRRQTDRISGARFVRISDAPMRSNSIPNRKAKCCWEFCSVHVANERWSRSKANTTLNTIRGADNARSYFRCDDNDRDDNNDNEHEIDHNFDFECLGTDTCVRSNLFTPDESPRLITWETSRRRRMWSWCRRWWMEWGRKISTVWRRRKNYQMFLFFEQGRELGAGSKSAISGSGYQCEIKQSGGSGEKIKRRMDVAPQDWRGRIG